MRFSQVVRSNQHETDTNSIFISIRAKMGGLQEIVTCGIIVGYGSCTYHIIHFLAVLFYVFRGGSAGSMIESVAMPR